MSSQSDFTVWRGNSYRMIGWSFPFDISGNDIVLTISWPSGSIVKRLSDQGLELVSETIDGNSIPVVYWTPTVPESLQIPRGRIASYELERIVPGGEQRTYVSGQVIGMGGGNVG